MGTCGNKIMLCGWVAKSSRKDRIEFFLQKRASRKKLLWGLNTFLYKKGVLAKNSIRERIEAISSKESPRRKKMKHFYPEHAR